MATLLFAAAGAAIGGSIGGGVLGVSSVVIGRAIGGTIGRMMDQALFAPTQSVEGPRLDGMDVQTSQEGAPIPVVEGHGRVAGQIIWATRLEERSSTSSQGGKGGGGAEVTEYSYFANFAVALTDCATGPIRHLGRVWADGKPLDMSKVNYRFYKGTETQGPDPLIVAKDGSAPAYRGISYIVFDRLPLEKFARRIPNLTFEVWGQSGEMEDLIRGVDVIPAASEFGYSPTVVTKAKGPGSTGRENAVRYQDRTDWTESMDLLESTLPNCGTVALVVSWFGTDLRCGSCQIEPRVELKGKNTSPSWGVAGINRGAATLVSYIDGKPAFGSTPDDDSVVDAIQDLKARGFRVVLYPFIMMDIPSGNTLPDPDTGLAGQAVYPWRGRIRPAAANSVSSEVSAFLTEYRPFILHLANLASQAGGVDAFLVGSEMVSMTMAKTASDTFPFVDGLVTLAADVSAIIPSAQISYAADWSEFHSYRVGSDIFFHLDPFWSSPDVDFVGIDNYLPLSDWRPGTDHLDYDPAQGHTTPYSLDYLKGQIEGGEYWDYFYASQADRDAQVRTPIFDGLHGEDWIFRQKAIRDWWSNSHHNRPGGVRDASATAWVPSSKPVWFTEFGCPAVNNGANQPNLFFDAKSSEAGLPYYSNGTRDDFMQRQYTRATLEWWRDNGGACVNIDNTLVWSWDARPWPEFPRLTGLWSDGPNWRRGHWLNGRAGSAPAAEVLERRLVTHYGFTPADFDLSRCYGQADGMVLPGPVSFREILSTWEMALRLDAAEFGGEFQVKSRAAAVQVAAYEVDDLVEDGERPLYQIVRSSLEEIPRRAVVRYSDTDRDYQIGAARAAIRQNPGEKESATELSLVSDLDRMTAITETILRAAADQRETLETALPRSSTLEPGDLFTLTPRNGNPIRFIAQEVTRGASRRVKAALYSDAVFGPSAGPVRIAPTVITPASETALPYLLDLPLLPGVAMDDHQGLAVFYAEPWPGGADLYRSSDQTTGFRLNSRTGVPGTVGETTATLLPGSVGVWSGETLEVLLYGGGLVSRPDQDVLDGANAMAVEHAPGVWEILQFQTAELIAPDTWRLSRLLRGQLGTEWLRDPGGLAPGARIALVDQAILPVEMLPGDVDREFWWRGVPTEKDQAEVDAFAHTFTGVARRPFAPVHLKLDASTPSTSTLSWIRRTRIEGNSWNDAGDVPLGEAFERYKVEVGAGGSPAITATVDDATTTTLDLSGLAGPQEVRVYQVSETYGPGVPGRLSVTL